MKEPTLILSDCLEAMTGMGESVVDTIITDPPYGLDFMGKNWDHGVPGTPFWDGALRVAKPGAMLLAFGGTRTYHRLACAIEDAGWEIRDCLMWLYGSGFPKSMDISNAIDKAAGAIRGKEPCGGLGSANSFADDPWTQENAGMRYVREPITDAAKLWNGWGTALKPAWEPIIVAMKPLDGTFAENAQRHGVAGLNIDGARIGTEQTVTVRNGNSGGIKYGRDERVFQRINPPGRWPANLLLDEWAAKALDAQSGHLQSGASHVLRRGATTGKGMGFGSTAAGHVDGSALYGDSGGASRFFYCAKASRSERGDGNDHPTVKPVKLMEYLCRLTATPTGGVVLDPFMGSGTTGVACVSTGREFIGIERDGHYLDIAKRRIIAAMTTARSEAA